MGRQATSISVWLDPSVTEWLTLNPDGSFSSYANLQRKPPESGTGHFRSDEEVWQAAEELISRFDPPPGLLRHTLKRRRGITDIIYCNFDVKPYGYWSEAGNCASVSFQASEGAVLHSLVGRGWSHEPPNIRVAEAEARAIAAAGTGRDADGWSYVIKWAKSTPDPKRRGVQKTQRLIYSMYRDDGDGGVLIDTVTGELVGVYTGLAGQDISGGQNYVAKPMNSSSDAPESRQKLPGGWRLSPYLLPAAGLLSLLVAIAVWRARTRVAGS